jgi:hypothetical protein
MEFIVSDENIGDDGKFIGNDWIDIRTQLVGSDTIEKVVFPQKLLYIPEAFCYNMPSLKEVVFSNTLVSVGTSAFEKCPKLELDISKLVLTSFDMGVKFFHDNCFRDTSVYCSGDALIFTDNFLYLGYGAFSRCPELNGLYVYYSDKSTIRLNDPRKFVPPFDGTDVVLLKRRDDVHPYEEFGNLVRKFVCSVI